MAIMLTRLYRKVVLRHFGSLRNCLAWLFAVILTVYVLDNYVFTKQQLHIFIGEKSVNKASDTVQAPVVPAAVSDPKIPVPIGNKPAPDVINERKPDAVVNNNPQVMNPKKCLVECPMGQLSYYIKSGKDRNISPIMCFDSVYVMTVEKSVAKRGINVVVINNNTLAVEDTRTFDVYEGDLVMQRYLKVGVQDGHLILGATLDEASFHLTDDGRKILKLYGSTLISKLGFRDNFVMIGQKGLQEGSAIEKHVAKKDGQEFSETIEISGCLKLPLGSITPIVVSDEERIALAGGPKVGFDKPNCGVKETCAADSFAVQMFTGIENKFMTKMCVNGKYVFGEGLNDAGRGLNIAIVSPKTMEVVRVGHFDTFGADSSNLEIFMEMLAPQDIVIVTSYDEASTSFEAASRKLFEPLGSSFVNKLSFRDAWVFVGQHGIVGYTEIEELSPANGGWPKPIDKILCVPVSLKGRTMPFEEPKRLAKTTKK